MDPLDDRALDLAIAEYEAHRAGTLRELAHQTNAHDGWVEYCGDLADDAHWTATYVRAEDLSVTPLAVGSCSHVIGTFKRLDEARARIWDSREFPRPAIVLGGKRHTFRATRGRVLVGVAATSADVVLLVALGERLALVYLDEKKPILLLVGTADSLRGVDVDAMLEFHRRRTVSRSRPAHGIGSSTRAHHARIVEGTRVAVEDGPALIEVLRHGFDNLAERAANPRDRKKHQRVCGKTRVRHVTDHLFKLVVMGCRDLHGRPGQILEQIRERLPGFEISPDALGDVLRLLLATGTPIVALVSDYIWEIKLVGLNRPDSEQHRRFCSSTAEICRINEAPRAPPVPGTDSNAKAPVVERHARDDAADPSGPAFPAVPENLEANILPMAILLGARLAVDRVRAEATQTLSTAKEAWAREREAFEKQLLDMHGSLEILVGRFEAATQAAQQERAELLQRLEQTETLARAAQEAAASERADLLARVELAEAEARSAREKNSPDAETSAEPIETALTHGAPGRGASQSCGRLVSVARRSRPGGLCVADEGKAETGPLVGAVRTRTNGRGDGGQLGPRGPPVSSG